VAVLLGIAIARVITRGIVGAVNHAREGALHTASGDLTHALGGGSRDEVGQLVNALEWMREAVGDAVAGIRRDVPAAAPVPLPRAPEAPRLPLPVPLA
jgi:methyl-accepting chemotaxis protein